METSEPFLARREEMKIFHTDGSVHEISTTALVAMSCDHHTIVCEESMGYPFVVFPLRHTYRVFASYLDRFVACLAQRQVAVHWHPEESHDAFYQRVVTCHGWALAYVPKLHLTNKMVVSATYAGYWRALEIATMAIWTCRDTTLQVVRLDARAFPYAHPRFLRDVDVVTTVLAQRGDMLGFVTCPILRADRELVAMAVTQNGLALEYAMGHWVHDPEMITLAVNSRRKALLYARVDDRRPYERAGPSQTLFLLRRLDRFPEDLLKHVLVPLCHCE
jgi:hypothetical protein